MNKKKLYIVSTHQFLIGTDVPTNALRLVTDDPVKALNGARSIYAQKYADWVEKVMIYEMEEGKLYSIMNNQGARQNDSKNSIVVFIAWENPSKEGDWFEHFYGSFKQFEPVLPQPAA